MRDEFGGKNKIPVHETGSSLWTDKADIGPWTKRQSFVLGQIRQCYRSHQIEPR